MSRESKNYHVPESLAGSQLAAALRILVGELSWNAARKLIERRQVQVNGNLCVDPARKLKAADVLKVWTHPLSRPADERDVKLVFVDEHLVVVHKPSGVTTLRHPEEKLWPADRKQLQPTLDELVGKALAKYLGWSLPEQNDRDGRPPRRPYTQRELHARRDRKRGARNRWEDGSMPPLYAVHRLDRDTSGLIVFARTHEAETALIRIFRKHTIDRAYVAVVHGLPKAQTIASHLVRDRGDGIRGSTTIRPLPADAQHAVTHIKPLKRIGDLSLIECRLETGRTHQIRIHLSELGHMLCGEGTYTHELGKPARRDPSGAPRQALHAAELGFVHPITGEEMHFRAPLPEDLRRWLLTKVEGQTKPGKPSPPPPSESMETTPDVEEDEPEFDDSESE